ncbi:MAG: response regulator [Oxalobacteraceae bacterium]|nr:MAG: response regulator [Oxalobacteraceae bacterium]
MSSLAGRRIMVVEDSYDLAREACMVLQAAGAQIAGPFATAANALKDLQHCVPDCALLDVNLGEGASFGLARMLLTRGIPFLFFTGYDANALLAEFAGVERLEKPVNAARLVQAVETCCRDTEQRG